MEVICINRPDHSTAKSSALGKIHFILNALFVVESNPLVAVDGIWHFLGVISVHLPSA